MYKVMYVYSRKCLVSFVISNQAKAYFVLIGDCGIFENKQ